MARTEFASANGPGPRSALEGLAKRSGRPLSEIVDLARDDRLCELYDKRGFVGKPLTGAEASRRLEAMRQPGLDPGLALLRLRQRAAQ